MLLLPSPCWCGERHHGSPARRRLVGICQLAPVSAGRRRRRAAGGAPERPSTPKASPAAAEAPRPVLVDFALEDEEPVTDEEESEHPEAAVSGRVAPALLAAADPDAVAGSRPGVGGARRVARRGPSS